MRPKAAMSSPKNGVARTAGAPSAAAAEAQELSRDQERIEAATRPDKISAQLGSRPYITDWIAPWFLGKNGTRLRASRYYMTERIVVDTFTTQRAYDEAEVELRRALCQANGVKYAALGPTHRLSDIDAQVKP